MKEGSDDKDAIDNSTQLILILLNWEKVNRNLENQF